MDSRDRGIFVLRAVLGLGFLFAGLDKLLLGPFSAASFLAKSTAGNWLGTAGINPTKDFWVSLAGNPAAVSVINVLVVSGELAIGVSLILGLATRFASVCGVLMMTLFFVAQMSFASGPFNNQLMYGLIAGVIAYVGAGAYALDSVVEKLAITERIPVVKYALG
ncbi:MAG: DoxX family protein [Candidatus Limnocylindrales bacterium]